MSRHGVGRGLIVAALAAGSLVPAIRFGPDVMSSVIGASRFAPQATPAASAPTKASAAGDRAPTALLSEEAARLERDVAPSTSAAAPDPILPPALSLAPASPADVAALSAIEQAAPSGGRRPTPTIEPNVDAVTAAVARFADPVDTPPLALDSERLRAAVASYRGGDVAGGDALSRALNDPAMKLAAEWAAIRLQPRRVGLDRLRAFQSAHADWPSAKWIERRIEEALYGDRKDARAVLAAFRNREPDTAFGEIAVARAELAQGSPEAAAARVRRLWREAELSGPLEQAIEREFSTSLVQADHKARSDLLFYKEKYSASLSAAKAAGPDALKLAEARAVAGTKRFDALVAALPKEMRNDPTLIFARAQALANAENYAEAAKLLTSAPSSDPAALVDGDAWWAERRAVARKLLDRGEAAAAYAAAAAGGAASAAGKVESAFLAGWIALRHLSGSRDDALRAKAHFDAAAAAATTPTSTARAAYWQGRAAETLGDGAAARAAYEIAARRAATFYGQLAAAKLGRERPTLRQATPATQDSDFTRAFRALYESGERALATPLALDAAKAGGRDGELAALSDWIGRRRDARTALAIGKAALVAGGSLDETAFPTYGVPAYNAAPNSAETAVVYSIARQESAFQPEAVSPAGAKGLMQMLDSTARETAKRAGLPFEERRMLTDPAFNAKLGAAHLGALLSSLKGSYVLAFAAYNAGPGRVREWLQAYGDPREPTVDPIDWIERIPLAETRDYVQKTIENLQVYRLRLGDSEAISIDADLRRGARRAAR